MRDNRRFHVQVLPKVPMGTLPGFGWLREAPRPQPYRPREAKSPEEKARYDALRKCVFFPAPPMNALRAAVRVKTDPGLFQPPLRRRDQSHDRDHDHGRSRERERGRRHHGSASGWDDPLSVGILLAVVPPVGFMLLWSSQRYSRDAKIAITSLMTVFMILATTAVCTALLVLR
jgi:hypothetical protein